MNKWEDKYSKLKNGQFDARIDELRDKEDNKTATKEQNIQIGAGIANIDITTTTNYNETKRGGYEHYVQVGKENTEVTMEQTLISEILMPFSMAGKDATGANTNPWQTNPKKTGAKANPFTP